MKSEEIGELKDLLKDSVADVTRLRLKNEDQYQELLKLRGRNKKLETALKWISTTSKDEHAVNLAGEALMEEKQEGCCGVVGMVIDGRCEHCGKKIKEDR